MSKKMQAIVFKKYGSEEVLELAEIPKPTPWSDEVLIEIHASSVNPIDWKLRSGAFKYIMPLALPAIPGFDLCGKVVEVGSKVIGLKAGDEVFARSNKSPGRSCAEFIALKHTIVALKPQKMNSMEAAAVPLAALTALQALRDKGGIKANDRVLINGASGGVGMYAIQIAKAYGAHVTGVCSNANHKLIASMGADRLIDYQSENPLSGESNYNIIFDAVANLTFAKSALKLTQNGVYITTVPDVRRFARYSIGNLISSKKERFIMMQPSKTDLELVTEMIDKGQVQSIIDSVFPLSKLAEAHKHSQSGRARGKIIISIKK